MISPRLLGLLWKPRSCSQCRQVVMAASVAYRASVMASRVRPSSTPGVPRISALTVLLEAQRMVRHGPERGTADRDEPDGIGTTELDVQKSITHRMIYVARITPGQAHRGDIPDHYERLFHRLIKSNLGESISGLLLLYPGCVIHMIEASSEILSGINQDLIQIQGAKSLLQDIRILVISHNIRSRLLPQWYFHIVTLPTQYLGDVGSGLSEETVVEECFTLMLKLGVFLSQILSPGSKGLGGNLHDLAPELLVREENIDFLIRSETFLTPEKFLKMYNKPINSSVASAFLWPAPQHLYV
ncbi:testis-expressed protein 47-like isoform X1 [Ranitomeya variabilis]|uniref:testis-expressed protein 47-like isoform X1 n=1 Tax=Ranitomeya variabilis TaxID=490064 RepID=UPI004057240D